MQKNRKHRKLQLNPLLCESDCRQKGFIAVDYGFS